MRALITRTATRAASVVAEERVRRLLVRDLRLLHDVLAATPFGPCYSVCGGLLLGWAREGRPLPNDPDVDFFYEEADVEAFDRAVPRLVAAGFDQLYRFSNNEGIQTEHSFIRNDTKFEFFRTFPAGEGRRRYFTYSPHPVPLQMTAEIPAQPTVPFTFLDRTWLKPQDHEAELRAMYGNWRKPDSSWSYLDELCVVDRSPWTNTTFVWE
jgi:hypothetical protein